MTLSEFVLYFRGMVFGAILLGIFQIALLYSIYLQLFKKSKLQTLKPVDSSDQVPHRHTEPWPQEILEFLQNQLDPEDPTDSNPETCRWLNIIVQRYFIELRASALFKEKTLKKISESLNERLEGNQFVTGIELKDIDLGINPPQLSKVLLKKGIEQDYAVVCQLDLSYVGGLSFCLEAVMTGISVQVKVHMGPLKGQLLVRCPSIKWSDMLCVSFAADPGVEFIVDSPITVRENEMVRDLVNKVLAKIVKRAFLETWVAPNWRSFYLPLLYPSPEQILARKSMQPCPSIPVNSVGLKLFKNGQVNDWLSDQVFHVSSELDPLHLHKHSVNLKNAFKSVIETKKLEWRTLKNRNGIHFSRAKAITTSGQLTEFNRTDFEIDFEPEQVFAFLSNPRHNSQIDENYAGFNILQEPNDHQTIIHGAYQQSKTQKAHYLVYQVKESIQTNHVVVCRSIQGYNNQPFNLPATFPIYIYGYSVSKVGEKTLVTAISNVCPTLSKMSVSFNQAKTIKTLLEQVKELSLNSEQIQVFNFKKPQSQSLQTAIATTIKTSSSVVASTSAWITQRLKPSNGSAAKDSAISTKETVGATTGATRETQSSSGEKTNVQE